MIKNRTFSSVRREPKFPPHLEFHVSSLEAISPPHLFRSGFFPRHRLCPRDFRKPSELSGTVKKQSRFDFRELNLLT